MTTGGCPMPRNCRASSTTTAPDDGSAAIDPLFNITTITNEAGELDYPWFWTSTTHAPTVPATPRSTSPSDATGYMHNAWLDVHGAGARNGATLPRRFLGVHLRRTATTLT
ncbi:MAG: hypothetical protein R2854_25675 [Caldilineaceae bacterium]